MGGEVPIAIDLVPWYRVYVAAMYHRTDPTTPAGRASHEGRNLNSCCCLPSVARLSRGPGNPAAQRDLLHSWVGVMGLWVLPVVAMNVANSLYGNSHVIGSTVQGSIQTGGMLWIGVGCFINGRRCGRLHCRIVGYLAPLFTTIGVLNLLHVVHINWAVYSDSATALIVMSFVAEFLSNRLRHAR